MKTIKAPKKKTKQSSQNLSERKKAEEMLKDSKEEYKVIFEGATDGILAADVKTKRLVFANPKICEITGYSLKELLKLDVTKIHPKKDLPYVSEQFKKQIQGKITLAKDIPVLRKDKKVVYCDINSKPIKIRKQELLVGFFRDVTERKKAEETLRESEERFRALTESTSDWIWEVDENAVYIYASPKVKQFLGYEPEEIIGKTPFDLMLPEEAKRITAVFGAIVETRKSFDRLENANLHKDGRIVVLETSGVPIFDVNGNFRGYRGIDRDITERKWAEEEIKGYQQKIETLINSSRDLVFLKDKDFRYLIANKAHEKLFNTKVKDIIGKTDFDFMPEEVAEGCRRSDEEALKSKNPIEREEFVDDRCFQVVKQRVVDVKGNIIGIAAVIRDATERKRVESALREEKNKLQKYFDIAGVIIAIVSINQKVLLINKRGCEILEYSMNEVIGKNWFDNFFSGKDRIKAKDVFDKLASGKIIPVQYFESPVLTKDGRKRIIGWYYTILKDETGKIQAVLSTGGDITDLKQAEMTIEQLRELDKLKDDFLNIAAHEFKTPLTSIIGLSEVIKEQRLLPDHQYQKYVDIIHKESNRLSHIVKRILTVTRYESARENVRIRSFNLTTFISSLLPSLQMLAEEKKSRIVIKTEKKDIVIENDKEKISQVIYNLVDNAVKYGPERQTITVSITKPEKDQIKISVIDQGKGIPSVLQKRLFTKFGQLEPSLSRSQEGTGLGLYICKLIIDSLGGEIGVKSILGKGSTFYFTFSV